MGKKIAKTLIIIIFAICLLLILGDIYLPYDANLAGVESNLIKPIKDMDTVMVLSRPEAEKTADFVEYILPAENTVYVEKEPFDPMSLIQSQFYIYQPIEKVDLYSQPKESRVYKQINSRNMVTYGGNMENGYHKVYDNNGRIYYINNYDMQRNMKLISISEFAVTENAKIPWQAECFVVKYDGDRVLRYTKSIFLKDNVAGIVEKGQTVYKLRDYGQIFYVVLEDGTVGYMNSQCLETIETTDAPYDIVSAADSTYAYGEMMEDIELLTKRYENHLKVVEVGKSTLGNDIPVLLMGNEDAEYKILVQGTIHAREYPSTAALMKHLEVMLYHIEQPNSSGKTYDEMLDELAYYIIPMTNPDGALLSQMGEISIADQKIRQQVLDFRIDNVSNEDSNDFKRYFELWKSNINGVDLNRNFDANWDKVNDAGGKPSSDGYKGSEIFSEAESRLIKKYVDMEDVKVTVSYHTSGNLIFWWYYQEGDFRYVCLDFAKAIGNKSSYELLGKGESRYSHGGVKDYGVMLGKPGITYEIGRYSSPIPPLSVSYAIKRVRVLPEMGYWLLDEIEDEAEWIDTNMFTDELKD